MSLTLEEQIEQEEAELAKLEAAEDGEGVEDADTDADTTNDDQNDDADGEDDSTDGDTSDIDNADEDDKKDGDDDKADKDDSDKDDVDAKNPNDVAAKLRIERRERLKAQEELAEYRRRVEEGTKQPSATDAEKKPETVEERLARIEHERDSENLQKQAVEEFTNIEKEFAATTPDYEDASKHMISSMYQGVKHAYPQLNDNQAALFVQKRVLEIASQAARNNMNPAEVLYQMAFDKYGFDGVKAQAPAEKKPTPKADNLKNIAKNKKRSASPLIGGGQTAGANVTIDDANNMDLADFGKMSESEIDALINQAG